MTVRVAGGRSRAESVDDLAHWLQGLQGCPPVHRTVTAACRQAAHTDEPGTWFYVEADRAEGVARLRCLACGDARSLFDSAERWTFPTMWSCRECRQAIAEVVVGLHVESGEAVTWAAVAVRCVNCGDMTGVTDVVLPGLSVDEVVSTL